MADITCVLCRDTGTRTSYEVGSGGPIHSFACDCRFTTELAALRAELHAINEVVIDFVDLDGSLVNACKAMRDDIRRQHLEIESLNEGGVDAWSKMLQSQAETVAGCQEWIRRVEVRLRKQADQLESLRPLAAEWRAAFAAGDTRHAEADIRDAVLALFPEPASE